MANRKEHNEVYDFDGKFLQEVRVNNGYTQQELAKRMNISLQTLVKWENGYSRPRLLETYELAKLFDISMEKFIYKKQ